VAVIHNTRWVEAYANVKYDEKYGPKQVAGDGRACTKIINRKTMLFVSIAQPAAGKWLEISYDGTYSTRINSHELLATFQCRCGLYISAAETLQDALEAAGKEVDRVGDRLASAGKYNRRHSAVLRTFTAAIRAVAVGDLAFATRRSRASPRTSTWATSSTSQSWAAT